jgi:diacylglycerol kinase family enzyme/membrane-associated phospholipid phosphatase
MLQSKMRCESRRPRSKRPSAGSGLGAIATALDRRVMRRWARPRRRPVDQLVVALSRAADHSVLWLVFAAAGAASGDRRAKRAAADGMLAIAFTSASVNGPFKWIFRRRRPTPQPRLHRRLHTSSFPSGHSASAFAFAVAATRELPEAGPVLLPLATSVAFSRVYLGVHYPTDVVAGAAYGTAVGMAARSAARKLGLTTSDAPRAPAPGVPSEAVLVRSPHSGRSRGLERARQALGREGIRVAEELDIEHVDRLPEMLRTGAGGPRLVIAAGGDGTVGSVAGRLVGTDNVLGILPLGTGNDFARALRIPLKPRAAAEQFGTGEISSVDLGRVTRYGQPPTYFAHAATVGLNVNFAKLATEASVRARLGRLTYLAAAVYAVRESSRFRCSLEHEGGIEKLELMQLSVISAPVIGGALGLNVRSPYPDDHRLDVLAVEDVPPLRMLRAGIFLLLGIKRPVPGIRALHVERLGVGSEHPLALTLDGELDAPLPGEFEMVAGAVRVVTPRGGYRESAGRPRPLSMRSPAGRAASRARRAA